MKNKRVVQLILCAVALLYGGSISAENAPALIPLPNKVEIRKGLYFKSKKISIKQHYPDSLAHFGSYLHRSLSERLGEDKVEQTRRTNVTWRLTRLAAGDEAYRLSITPNNISLEGSTKRALLYAAYTLDQWLMSHQDEIPYRGIPCVTIEDAPLYPHRAMMLDPARHFLPVNEVLYFIDIMSYYKFNKLQLHLTDDQGWRVEIKSHPELALYSDKHGGKSNRKGVERNYYTQDDLRKIIAFANDRGITIVPEVNVPGHTAAFQQAMPQLKCDVHRDSTYVLGKVMDVMISAVEPATYKVLDDVFRELSELFPGGYIHLGGDESALDRNWDISPEHQAFMKEQGMKDSSELMQYFFERVVASVRKYGMRPLLWCEFNDKPAPEKGFLFRYPKEVTLVSWLPGLTPLCLKLAKESGNPVILAPSEHAYLDYPQYTNDLPEFLNWGMPITTLEKTYSMESADPNQTTAIGLFSTLWAEAIIDINRACYMAWPRGMALAEIGWTKNENRHFEEFTQRLAPHLNRLMLKGVPFRVPFEVYRKNQNKDKEL